MGLEHFVAFNLALLAAILSPGPALLVAVRTSLSAGRKAGIAVGCGLGLMAATWTAMALLGLDAIFNLFPWAYTIAKAVGAVYLLYIAYRMWAGASRSYDAGARPLDHAFLQGVLINLLNPKSVLFAAAVLIVIFPAGMSAGQNALVVFNHLIVEIFFYITVAFAMSSRRVGNAYLRAKLYIDRAAAFIVGSLGLRLLVSR